MEETDGPKNCMAFAGVNLIAKGPIEQVAAVAHAHLKAHKEQSLLFFDCETAEQIELDLRGTCKEVLARLAPAASAPQPDKRPGPGRPKLGVVCQEVCLLPRHWEWLGTQPAGASGTLRRLVDEARKANAGKDRARRSQEAAHRFMWAMAGNFAGFEEATRAFFAGDYPKMKRLMRGWPADVRDCLWELVVRTRENERLA